MIYIEEVKIRNYKCFENIRIKTKNNNLLLGANNVGKTSLLEAIEIGLTHYNKIDSNLIYLKKGEEITNEKKCIIDILISHEGENFSSEWTKHFGKLIFEGEDKDYIAIRTIIAFNEITGEYESEKKSLKYWDNDIDILLQDNHKDLIITKKLLDAIPVFYLDAKRDILSDMKNKYSYWGKMVKDIKLSKDEISLLEANLQEINHSILEKSEILDQISLSLGQIKNVLGSKESSIEINPISKRIKDLDKGMEIRINDGESESFSVENLGMGTRSWTAFLTLTAYIELKSKEMKEKNKPFFPILLLEEPESHLHPHGQRKIFDQMKKLLGQKFISTHSPIISAQCELDEIIHVYKKSSSNVNHINLESLKSEEVRKIKEEIIKTRGELLFADAIILGEGETEEQVIHDFFYEYFSVHPFELGVNIIGVGGSGKYKPYLQVAKDLDIDIYIFSDGEKRVINEVKKTIKSIYGEEEGEIFIRNNVIFLPNEYNFEKYLIGEGYIEELSEIIANKYGSNYIEYFIKKNNHTEGKSKKTKEKCECCKQNIYISTLNDYDGDAGFNRAILTILSDMKTEYSANLAKELLEREDETKIPAEIRKLFSLLEINY